MLIFLNISNPTNLTDLSDLTSECRENSIEKTNVPESLLTFIVFGFTWAIIQAENHTEIQYTCHNRDLNIAADRRLITIVFISSDNVHGGKNLSHVS